MLPEEMHWLFWDVDAASIDLDAHRDYVFERVMSRGDMFAMQWLARRFAKADLARFLDRFGERLAPRERAFWCLVAEIPAPASPGGGRPPWAGQ